MNIRHPLGLPASLLGVEHALVVGVLNVTPDSFSDGGKFADVDAAIAHGVALRDQGASFVDVGGESTRPGATRVTADDEQARVLEVIAGLTEVGVHVSIDTMHASTAVAAIEAGAFMVNDVSGGLADAAMVHAVADMQVPYVIMHWRGHSTEMNALTSYGDVVTDVIEELGARVDVALRAGIAPEAIVIDPGLGFAKEANHNWAILHQLEKLEALGYPVLIGASRKRFIGSLLGSSDGVMRPVDQRDGATDAISALAAAAGVWAVRVHDVVGSVDAVRVGSAWRLGRG
ncbi:MAG: dihydropteroate synthase [Candidatus Nanopelagicales bacterium]|nr:dihydropteroate synthase [Candidatus Nanopelagicales bacterium]